VVGTDLIGSGVRVDEPVDGIGVGRTGSVVGAEATESEVALSMKERRSRAPLPQACMRARSASVPIQRQLTAIWSTTAYP